MVPSFMSHIIAALSLAIPGMILAETGLELSRHRPPPARRCSWGVLLQDAQNIRTIVEAPWLLLPGVAVIITVLALNFFGDGLRDAADPYRELRRSCRARTSSRSAGSKPTSRPTRAW